MDWQILISMRLNIASKLGLLVPGLDKDTKMVQAKNFATNGQFSGPVIFNMIFLKALLDFAEASFSGQKLK